MPKEKKEKKKSKRVDDNVVKITKVPMKKDDGPKISTHTSSSSARSTYVSQSSVRGRTPSRVPQVRSTSVGSTRNAKAVTLERSTSMQTINTSKPSRSISLSPKPIHREKRRSNIKETKSESKPEAKPSSKSESKPTSTTKSTSKTVTKSVSQSTPKVEIVVKAAGGYGHVLTFIKQQIYPNDLPVEVYEHVAKKFHSALLRIKIDDDREEKNIDDLSDEILIAIYECSIAPRFMSIEVYKNCLRRDIYLSLYAQVTGAKL